LRGKAAADLARQLFVVLDRRLPARLNELSDKPEGSLRLLTKPDQDLVGTIHTDSGDVDVLVERISSRKSAPVWLFSAQTLDWVPELFEEISAVSVEKTLPGFFAHTRIFQVPLFEWLAVLVGLPALYFLTGLSSRLLSPCAGRLRRHLWRQAALPDPVLLPKPVRLLVMALIINWTLTRITLPLLARQFWSGTATVLVMSATVWLLILLNGWGEKLLARRLARINRTGATSILRLGRRTLDFLIVFAGVLAALHHFGVRATAALAGLGVGGIAVALAAQKTLENVIGGVSIIFDQAVRVGDFLSVTDAQGTVTLGTVEYIGLRSTRIRTLDRTLVSVPNGQLANVRLESFSARDKFWFHPTLSLRYQTTAAEMCSVLEGISNLLAQHPQVERESSRARFLKVGTSSLEVEVFAYVVARDWPHFLETQQDLLLQVMGVIEAAGARLALQSQTVYLEAGGNAQGNGAPGAASRQSRRKMSSTVASVHRLNDR